MPSSRGGRVFGGSAEEGGFSVVPCSILLKRYRVIQIRIENEPVLSTGAARLAYGYQGH